MNQLIKNAILLPLILLITFIFSLKINAESKTLIFPYPQKIQLTEASFTLDEKITILTPQKPADNDIFLASFLIRELSDKYGIALKTVKSDALPDKGRFVLMGRFDNPLVSRYLKLNNLTVSEKNPGSEGYYLEVSADRIIIAGSDDAGAFYGLQSLRQLIDAGDGKSVQGLKVTDWPAFPFRAVSYMYPDRKMLLFSSVSCAILCRSTNITR